MYYTLKDAGAQKTITVHALKLAGSRLVQSI
jgi:hypothetical protein